MGTQTDPSRPAVPQCHEDTLKAPKTEPFCLRFTHEERARLEAAANGVPLGPFIRGLVLGAALKPRRARNLYDTVSAARAATGRYLAFDNGRRPHSSLARRTPDQATFDGLPHPAAA